VSNIRWGIIAAVFALLISIALGMISSVRLVNIIVRAVIFAVVFFGLGFGLRFVLNNFFPELLYSDDSISQGDLDQTGSRINITVDSSGEYAVPELYKTSDDSEEMGNIEDLISGIFRPRGAGEIKETSGKRSFSPALSALGIDDSMEAGYNDIGALQDVSFPEDDVEEVPGFNKQPVSQPVFSPSFGDDSGLGGLPDLDMMARAFSSAYSSSPTPVPSSPAPASSASSAPSSPMAAAFTPMSPVESFESEKSRYKGGNIPQTLEGDFNPKSLAEGLRTVLSKDK